MKSMNEQAYEESSGIIYLSTLISNIVEILTTLKPNPFPPSSQMQKEHC